MNADTLMEYIVQRFGKDKGRRKELRLKLMKLKDMIESEGVAEIREFQKFMDKRIEPIIVKEFEGKSIPANQKFTVTIESILNSRKVAYQKCMEWLRALPKDEYFDINSIPEELFNDFSTIYDLGNMNIKFSEDGIQFKITKDENN